MVTDSANPGRRIVVVSPCRNEEEHVEATIRTVAAQTVPPARWVIVDDGSDDRTPEILAAAAEEHDFIEVVTRGDRGQRVVGAGVIEAFYSGLETVRLDDYDYDVYTLALRPGVGKSTTSLLVNARVLQHNRRLCQVGQTNDPLDDSQLVPCQSY